MSNSIKVALCQINPILGNFDYNYDKILHNYNEALKENPDLVVFPEMVVTGYPPQDLLLSKKFIEKNLSTLNRFAKKVSKTCIVGFVNEKNGKLFNSAAICENGEIVHIYNKILLPTYDVFDEDRYFENGTEIGQFSLSVNGESLNCIIQICEDLWEDNYDRELSTEIIDLKPDLIVNISSSPYHKNRKNIRRKLILDKFANANCPFIYCNIVGGQDELIFDGNSLSFTKNGKINARGSSFEEEMIMVDFNKQDELPSKKISREEELFSALKLGMKDYFYKTGHKKSIIGLSGGIDSALTACLAVESLGKENVLCINMPSSFSSNHSKKDSKQLAINLEVSYKVLPIEDIFLMYEEIFNKEFMNFNRDLTEENIQARIRANFLMAFSNKLNYLVLATSNKTELALGYCTLYGDMSGSLSVISDLHKKDVYDVAKWYNQSIGKTIIPNRIFTKLPSAELNENQTDPFDYSIVSPLVAEIVEGQKTNEELITIGY